MSIIGTRPPLISETNLYELHHHARLAIKPGITGMWQVSGRSDITDFEEVVRLDKEYITNWNIGLDIKILFKTILVEAESLVYHPKQNGIVELQSLNFSKRAQFFVNAVPDEKQGDWADHLRGAAKMLGEKYRLKIGLSSIIEGSLPIGGLSSSASVIICFLSALCKVNDIHMDPMELILTAKAAENQYVGVSCGKLDQSCEVLSKRNHLLYLDGGRFSGAGFKGCCMALIDPDKVEDIEAKVTEEYLKAFPGLEGKYSFYVCESADGVRV